MPIISKNDRRYLAIMGFGFAGISAACEILLFTQSVSGFDFAINLTMAVLLVACQFIFAYVGVQLWQAKCVKTASIMLATVFVLFYVSVSGSAAYFDARYKSASHSSATGGIDYTDTSELIDSYKSESERLEGLADSEKEKGNHWQATQNQKLATKAKREWRDALSERRKIKTIGATSNEVLAASYKGNDFVIWYVYAVLIDLCPLLCFTALGLTVNKKTSIAKTDAKPHQKQIIKSAVEKDAVVFKDALYPLIEKEILKGVFGDKPSKRQVMLSYDLKSNPRMKSIFDQLEKNNVVKRDKNGITFCLVKREVMA